MFTRKLNYRQKDMMMKAERILPVDLYNSVSTPELLFILFILNKKESL